MAVRRTAGVLVWVSLAVACSSDLKGSGASNATGGGGGGGDANATGGSGGTTAGGGNATGGSSVAGAGAGTASAGSSGQGGAEIVAVGNGELDASCMMRTSVHVAGSRIVLRNAVTPEGDQAFVAFYDTQKLTECHIVQDVEGKFRCMPPALDKDLVNRFFLDDKCSSEVQYQGACDLAYQAEPVSSDSCDQRRHIYPFGDRVPDTMVYQPAASGECKPYGVLNNLFHRGAELVPADYAEVTPVVWRGAGRIWAQGYAGDGDLHVVTGFLDSQLNQPCDFQVLADGKEHCVPVRLGSLQYTDATCKQTLLSSSSTCGAPPASYATTSAGNACSPGISFVKADASYDGPRYSRSSCMPATNASSPAFSTKAAPDSDFLAVESTTLSTDAGRLKPVYRTAMDDGCFFRGWWDDQLQTQCSFASAYSGAPYYCLPEVAANAVATFSDSACMVPAPYVKVASCAGAAPPKFLAVYQPACVTGWRTVRSVEPTPAVLPPLWANSGGTCAPFTPDAAATYYAAGPIMANGMFVQAALEP